LRKAILILFLSVSFILQACSSNSGKEVLIQTNADDEAVALMEAAIEAENLDFSVTIQSIGTSELGGKLMAEGNKIEADIVTMSSYFLESAQQQMDMFEVINSTQQSLDDLGDYQIPILGNTGAIFINTIALDTTGVAAPQSIKDLALPQYENLISFPNLFDSSTGWLLIQAIIAEYGEKEGEELIKKIKENAGPHIESSGSGPIKKVKSGEVPIGFGLRNQAVQAQKEGLPIEVIDPEEGNSTLVESVSVVQKPENEKAEQVANIIAEKARPGLLEEYPIALYEGETVSKENEANFKKYPEKLTVELLEKHQMLFKNASE